MVSDTYRRRRRLAILIALVSVAFLIAGTYFGYFLETYSRPRLSRAAGGLRLLHEARPAGEDESQTALLNVDSALALRSKLKFLGDCRAAVSDGDELVLFFENRYSVIRDGQSVRGADLSQPWPVRLAQQASRGG